MENKHTQQVDFSNPNADKITSGTTNKPLENKHTAVEWLFEKLWETPKDKFTCNSILEQAKAMEKEQIIDFTRKAVRKILDEDRQNPFNLEQYYNETFKSE
jgi:hypothetical protein